METDYTKLAKRIQKLEAEVVALRRRLDGGVAESQAQESKPPPQPVAPATPPKLPQLPVSRATPARTDLDLAVKGERWLGRIGVVFLFLACAFLFRYSIVHGWVTPLLRLVTGLFTGVALLAVGLVLAPTRPAFSQILQGGAIAIFYLVGYAGFQLYGLVPYFPSFVFMVAVTVTALVLAMRQHHASLAVLGTAGGLATPFLVPLESGTLDSVMVYSAVILAGIGWLQFQLGWRSLLTTLVVGGGLVVFTATAFLQQAGPGWTSLAILCWWGVGAVSPLVRRVKPPQNPALNLSDLNLRALSLVVSWATLGMLGDVWSWDSTDFGGGLSVLAVLAAGAARWPAASSIRPLNAEAALHFALAAAVSLLDADPTFLVVIGLSAGGWMLGMRLALTGLQRVASVSFCLIGLWYLASTFQELYPGAQDELELHYGVRLAGVLLVFAFAFLVRERQTRGFLLLTTHLALMMWFGVELADQKNGLAWTSVAWGIQGLVPLLLSFRYPIYGLQACGLATLALVAGKMLLFDMAQLDLIWRILMFFGFGGAFLALSYLIRRNKAGMERPATGG